MYTDHQIGVNEHLAWLSKLVNNESQKVFAVLKNEKPVGIGSVNAIDAVHRKAEFAIYLDETERLVVGVPLEFTLIEYAFDRLKLEKLNCEVIETNASVLKFHERFGFTEEGFRRSNVVKNNSRVGVHFLGLTKEEWLTKKPEVQVVLDKVIESISIGIAENEPKSEITVLDQIRNTRAKNNINWMSLLQLCVEHHPQTSKPIIAEILRLDREISDLTVQLVE